MITRCTVRVSFPSATAYHGTADLAWWQYHGQESGTVLLFVNQSTSTSGPCRPGTGLRTFAPPSHKVLLLFNSSSQLSRTLQTFQPASRRRRTRNLKKGHAIALHSPNSQSFTDPEKSPPCPPPHDSWSSPTLTTSPSTSP